MHFFIITNFQTNVSWALDHPTGSTTSCFVPCPMKYSFLVSKHSITYYFVCNKASNTFNSITCRPPVRLRLWLLQLVPSPTKTKVEPCASYETDLLHIIVFNNCVTVIPPAAVLWSGKKDQRVSVMYSCLRNVQLSPWLHRNMNKTGLGFREISCWLRCKNL